MCAIKHTNKAFINEIIGKLDVDIDFFILKSVLGCVL